MLITYFNNCSFLKIKLLIDKCVSYHRLVGFAHGALLDIHLVLKSAARTNPQLLFFLTGRFNHFCACRRRWRRRCCGVFPFFFRTLLTTSFITVIFTVVARVRARSRFPKLNKRNRNVLFWGRRFGRGLHSRDLPIHWELRGRATCGRDWRRPDCSMRNRFLGDFGCPTRREGLTCELVVELVRCNEKVH